MDNALLTELASDNPSEERIRQLVEQGADVNSLDKFGDDSVLMDTIGYIQDGLPIRFVHLLIELGANVNYETEDGFSPLTEAFYTHKAEPVEILLAYGANPNIIIECRETLLDLVEFDQWYHECEGKYGDLYHSNAAQEVGKMIVLLKERGAKNLVDLRTEEVTRWLKIFASYPKSGLTTGGGFIEVDSIKELPDELKKDFKKWLASHWDSYPDDAWKDMPKDFDRHMHNEWGRRLAKQIKSYLPPEIKMSLFIINEEDERNFRRNVKKEEIN